MNALKRISKEPSSWAGVASIAQALAAVFPQWAAGFHIVTTVAGAVAVALHEKGGA